MDSVIHRRAASRLQNLVVRFSALEQREYILCAIQTSSSSLVAPCVLSVFLTCMLSRSPPCDKDGLLRGPQYWRQRYLMMLFRDGEFTTGHRRLLRCTSSSFGATVGIPIVHSGSQKSQFLTKYSPFPTKSTSTSLPILDGRRLG